MAVRKLTEKLEDMKCRLPTCSGSEGCPVSRWIRWRESAGRQEKGLYKNFPAQKATRCFSGSERTDSMAITCYRVVTPALDKSRAGSVEDQLSMSSRVERTNAMEERGINKRKKA